SISCLLSLLLSLFFFFNDPAPSEIYTLSLHDALPISISAEPTICKINFCSEVKPSFCFLKIFKKSSANPIPPKKIIVPTNNQTSLCHCPVRIDQISKPTRAADRKTPPPIAGVPDLALCQAGPSSLVTCPNCFSRIN